MEVLVDTSVWVDYFRNGEDCEQLDILIDENLVITNKLILAELVPFLQLRKENRLIALLNELKKTVLRIDWQQIIHYQYLCLKNGLNGVSIPDLLIAQNIIQHDLCIYSLDKHFRMMSGILGVQLFDKKSIT